MQLKAAKQTWEIFKVYKNYIGSVKSVCIRYEPWFRETFVRALFFTLHLIVKRKSKQKAFTLGCGVHLGLASLTFFCISFAYVHQLYHKS